MMAIKQCPEDPDILVKIRKTSRPRTQRESETLLCGCSVGMKLRLFLCSPSLTCLNATKPETSNPLVLRVHDHLVSYHDDESSDWRSSPLPKFLIPWLHPVARLIPWPLTTTRLIP
ncbi:uncharacterized protein LOC119262814 isoform X2 [Pygocentrus nattereri]|uniref:uncharacterized protein LOC119262814 isoform X2 n=1 Tax=Pygocentrus nattereri TaxID=42514 RepID=UPI001891297C|nr:uncharacterized protein LOC119262814 isoform X2 [Pygocentrus nattereri]